MDVNEEPKLLGGILADDLNSLLLPNRIAQANFSHISGTSF